MSFKPSPSRAGFFEKQKKAEPSLHFRKNKKSRAEPTCPIFHFEKTKNNETADISDIFLRINQRVFRAENYGNNVNGFSYGKKRCILSRNNVNGFPNGERFILISDISFSEKQKSRAEPSRHFRTAKKVEPSRHFRKKSRAEYFANQSSSLQMSSPATQA